MPMGGFSTSDPAREHEAQVQCGMCALSGNNSEVHEAAGATLRPLLR